MIKDFTKFLNEASVATQIQQLEAEVSGLRDEISDAKKAIDAAGTPEAKNSAKISALNTEATILTTISQRLRQMATLMGRPEETNV
jgi:predicted  nucleic acid-binding Zn-ribbon protein